MAATGIDIGDAVLTFLADTTQLDQAIARLNAETASKLQASGESVDALGKNFTAAGTAASAAADKITSKIQPATASVSNLGKELSATSASAVEAGTGIAKMGDGSLTAAADVSELTHEMAVAQSGARELGEVMTLSGEKAKFSMFEARGEVQLLGEEVGVRLPRHVGSFLAELPGIGSALSKAFEATAVLFLIQALIEGAEKLTEFISSTLIFTESMKKADEIISKNNADVARYADETSKLKDAFALLGKEGVAKTSAELAALQKNIESNNAALTIAEQKATALNRTFGESKDQAAELAQANAEVATLNAIRAENEQKRLTLIKQGAIERQAEAQKEALAEVQIEKDRATSVSDLKLQENRTLAADEQRSNSDLEQIEVLHQLELYNIQLASLERKLAVDKTDHTKDPGLIQKDNEAIEQLQRDHATALIKIYADTVAGINSLSLSEGGNRTGLADAILGTDFKDKFAQAEEAAAQLGIALSGNFAASADKAKQALDDLKSSGVATAHDLLAAETQLTVAQVNNARATGQSTQAIKDLILEQEKRIDQAIELALATGQDTTELQRSRVVLEQLDGTFKKGHQSFDTFFRDLARGALTAGQAMKELGQLTAEGIGASVTAAVSGSQTFGQAMEQFLKSTLASLAGVAVTHAIEEVAKAFSDFATAASMAADPFTAALAPGFAAAGNAHLIAAVKWGAVGAGAAIAGAAVPGGSGSQASGAASPSTGSTAGGGQITATQPEQNPVQTVNTQRLASGGLITQRTLAIIGDAAVGSGSQREAVIPVDDPRFMDAVAGEISRRIGPNGAVVNNHYWTIEGMISGDNLHKVAKKISSSVNKGAVRFNASNSLRITRRG